MRRKHLGSVLAVALAALVGCGQGKDPGGTAASAPQPAPPAVPAAPQPAPPAPAADAKADALARLRVVNDLRILAIGLESFADSNGAYPTADGTPVQKNDVLGRPRDVESTVLPAGFSWRATVLHLMSHDTQPELERDVFFKLCANKYPLAADAKPGENWNRPQLKDLTLRPYSCEIAGKTKEKWHTFNRVFLGNGAAFEPKKQLTRKDFPDGLKNTILVVEAGEAVPWPKPEELMYDPAKPLPKLGGQFPDGFYAVFADGTARFIKNGTDEKLIRAMITRNGGEAIAELPPRVDSEALRRAAGLKD